MKFISAAGAIAAIFVASLAIAAPVTFEKGDHVCLVGNALGERLQHHNYWEADLHARLASKELVVRNLCFPGDEPLARLRSLNFGSPDKHLTQSQADVILFFFGYNESFAGEKGLPAFKKSLHTLISDTKTKNYSGDGAPRMVLVSPIAFQDTGDRNLPSGEVRNKHLAMYTAAMKTVADETGVGFVDLFKPSQALLAASKKRLTYHGGHLNDAGYKALAPLFNNALLGKEAPPAAAFEQIRAAVADKNFHWWHRYRAVNGYSIYGKRGRAGTDGTYNNTDVMERERAILDQMTANRDARIWAIAQGKKVPAKVDDSKTLPFINPKTNVGGANDRNRKAGKLGSLDYLPAAEQQKRFKLAPGYEINLVASEEQFPELANPVAMNFDNKGRLWVSVMPSYPQWKPKTLLDDKLLILEDKNNDGRADECKVFARGLHQPTGFEIGHNGVFVAQQPDLLYLKDTNGDDKEDTRERRLVGFDTADSHHGLSAFEWGPGGGLYFGEGTFKQSQVETINGLVRMGDAGIWRYDPRNGRFDAHVSVAFANPWGHVFDRWGQNFIADASPGNNYWATPASGYVEYPDKHPGASRAKALDWQGSKSDQPYSTFLKKRIRPSSGCEFISSRNFPPEAQGNFLVNNVIGERAVLQHKIRESGSGFAGVEIERLVSGEDGNFRPVDLQFGPDGALYIIDWHNALIGHLQHNLREPNRDHSHGRIWRVHYTGRPLVKPPQIDGAPVADVVKLLAEYEDRTRYRVRRELAQRDTAETVAALEAWVAGLDAKTPRLQHNLLEALWVYQSHNVVNQELLNRVLNSPDHKARAAATRVLSFWVDRVDNPLKLLAKLVNDSHPRVRLEAVRACSFIHSRESLETSLGAIDHEVDEFLEYTINETIRVLESILSGTSGGAFKGGNTALIHGDQPRSGAAGSGEPLVFLDKSPAVVSFQLKRLPASQLMLIKTEAGGPRFKPVFEAILARAGVSRQDRKQAAVSLAELNKTTLTSELLQAIAAVNSRGRSAAGVIRQLTAILVQQPAETLKQQSQLLSKNAASDNASVRSSAFAGLLAAGELETAWKLGQSPQNLTSFLAAVPLTPSKETRAKVRPQVVSSLTKSRQVDVRRTALAALASISDRQEESFALVAPLLKDRRLRAAAVKTLASVPSDRRPAKDANNAVELLVKLAESTPAARRTTPAFLEAMHLAGELLKRLPVADARRYRSRLREVVVRVVRIGTVHEEMRYDTPFFAVEAGRPVQLVLVNDDLMPHNLVITKPGKLRDVAMLAAGMKPAPDKKGRQYVPATGDVLQATKMAQSHSQQVITFNAPKEPGEYPYVCTFPNHWMRMYGVMVVVDDLDAWQAKPVTPADPLGITRELVKTWQPQDFTADLVAGVSGASTETGQRIFKEATCLLCHKAGAEGGAVGPALDGVFARHKNDTTAVLRELLDPSHKVDPKYALYNVVTADGEFISGVITSQSRESITIISNADNPTPQKIDREDIEELLKSSTSIMPKGLMDRYQKGEIFALLAYLKSLPAAKE